LQDLAQLSMRRCEVPEPPIRPSAVPLIVTNLAAVDEW